MFKRNKHLFTCPDVIYLRARQKKMNRISIAVNVLFIAGLWVWGTVLDKELDVELEKITEDTPTEN